VNKLPALSIVVPFYNEEENIEETVRQIREAFEPRTETFEVLLVNDGSADRTGELADELDAADPRVRAVHHKVNIGYGAALLSGFKAASHELIFYTDGDLQFDLAEIDKLIPLLDGADVVTGYRGNRRDPWYRRMNAGTYNLVIRTLFGVKVKDLDCAFKIYRKSIFDKVHANADGIFISGEILIGVTRNNMVIKEVEVTHFPRSRGTAIGNNPLVVLTAMYELTKFCWNELTRRDIAPVNAHAAASEEDQAAFYNSKG
jgi:glycosyltransferase involved in cell wall biosynthesis